MKKLRKYSCLVGLIIIFAVMNMSGCASLRKKFIRKKEEKEGLPTYHRVKEYKASPSIELYTDHYIYWRSWHREIIELLGKNAKKDERCIREMIGNLEDMRAMLTDEKGDELEEHIKILRGIEKDIKKRNLTLATKTHTRRVLEKQLKLIRIRFTYTKMEPFIRAEFRERYEEE